MRQCFGHRKTVHAYLHQPFVLDPSCRCICSLYTALYRGFLHHPWPQPGGQGLGFRKPYMGDLLNVLEDVARGMEVSCRSRFTCLTCKGLLHGAFKLVATACQPGGPAKEDLDSLLMLSWVLTRRLCTC